jgi:hypothetical protein
MSYLVGKHVPYRYKNIELYRPLAGKRYDILKIFFHFCVHLKVLNQFRIKNPGCELMPKFTNFLIYIHLKPAIPGFMILRKDIIFVYVK